jgi:hypothetical protein
VEEWSLPAAGSLRRSRYIAEEADGLAGYFFPDEIVPAPMLEQHDTPAFTEVEKWPDRETLEVFLTAGGYCWQLYPVRMHHDRFCGPAHRGEDRGTTQPGRADTLGSPCTPRTDAPS